MTALRLRGLALVTGALTLAATAAPAAAYMQYQLKNAMVTSYSYNGSGANDLPEPPPMTAPAPGPTQAATPKLGEYAVKGKVFHAPPSTPKPISGNWRPDILKLRGR